MLVGSRLARAESGRRVSVLLGGGLGRRCMASLGFMTRIALAHRPPPAPCNYSVADLIQSDRTNALFPASPCLLAMEVDNSQSRPRVHFPPAKPRPTYKKPLPLLPTVPAAFRCADNERAPSFSIFMKIGCRSVSSQPRASSFSTLCNAETRVTGALPIRLARIFSVTRPTENICSVPSRFTLSESCPARSA